MSSAASTQFGACVVDDGGDRSFDIAVARPAARAIQSELPEAVALAVIEFITGPLLQNPRRVGKPLRGELTGLHSARRGTYRIIYRVDDVGRIITVLRVGHRGDVYR